MTEHERTTPAGSASPTAEEPAVGVPAPDRPELDLTRDTQTAPLASLAADNANAATEPLNPVLNDVWTGLKRLPNYARLATAMAKDPRVPRPAKAALVVGGGYLLSPIDLIPGFIPVAGQLDDLYVVLAALRQAIRSTPEDVAREHLRNAGVKLSDLDDDLGAIRRFVKVAAVKTARFGWRVARQTSQQVLQRANQARERARKGPDHEPL